MSAASRFMIFFCSFAGFSLALAATTKTIEDSLRADSDLSQFFIAVSGNPLASQSLQYMGATLFAPNNVAFQRHNVQIQSVDVLYHLSTAPRPLRNLRNGEQINTMTSGSPPVWITVKRSQRSKDEIYVNNARIIWDKSNITVIAKNPTTSQQQLQVLHVIDDILLPVVPKRVSATSSSIFNPNALDFLNNWEDIEIGEHRLRTFRDRVAKNNKNNVFQDDGKFTFFLPVDEAFKRKVSDKIDRKVIDGHIIPGHVLFTAPTPTNIEYVTLANEDMIKVTLSFMAETEGLKTKYYVKSNTIVGDKIHPEGRVLAEIVKANIPVKNGVIHLIGSPLMVVDSSVSEFLEEDPQGPLSRFYEVIREAGGDFLNRIGRLQQLTLFAPNNAAWNHTYLDNTIADKEALRRILDLHLVDVNLSVDDIVRKNVNSVETSRSSPLYFNVVQFGDSYNGFGNRSISVEGGGVNATIVTPDLATTNGRIHIINRVLGVPYQTIAEKLKSDPMMNITYILGQRTNLNDQLSNTKKRFTYFVPRDKAWLNAESLYPTALKKLIHMTEFEYHQKQILERHLVISDKAFTLEDLRRKSREHQNATFTLPSVRDTLSIRFREFDQPSKDPSFSKFKKGFRLEWRGVLVDIFRPDINCTNGVIHVIDQVLMRESDMTVASGNSCSPLLSLLTLTFFLNPFGFLSLISAFLNLN